MKLKKSKRLAQKQMHKLLAQTKDLVDNLDEVYDNKKLEEKLKEIKATSLEIIDYFIDNCVDQSSKIKDMNERNYPKRQSYEQSKEVINNEVNNENTN